MHPALPTLERIGHRGAPRVRTENTLPGFVLALEHGADAVELDVHATRDGEVVVHHDFDAGGRPLAESAWSDIREAALPGGERVPLLSQVLAALGTRATAYVELKGRDIEDRVAGVVRGHAGPFAFHSFDHDAIARCLAKHAAIPRGVLLDRNTANVLSVLRDAVARTQPRDVWPHHSLVDARFMDAAASLGVRVIVWTVNDVERARRLRDLGVAGICTDDVRLLASL